MLDIFKFYLELVVKIFNQVLQKFEVSEGIGFGTFLLACSLFVIFINLLKFNFSTGGIAELKEFSKRNNKEYEGKHVYKGKHSK